jgi:hypothetical protein
MVQGGRVIYLAIFAAIFALLAGRHVLRYVRYQREVHALPTVTEWQAQKNARPLSSALDRDRKR